MIRLIALAALLLPTPARAETATVAVATNFAETAEDLAAAYGKESGHSVVPTAGATGKLFAQIRAGAPFDALLSADQATPDRIATEGLGDPASRVTYAVGVLALWSADGTRDLSDPGAALAAATHVAVANPDLAPYGKAAAETIAALGLTEALAAKLVTGGNIGQAHALAASGAADLGFVAASALAATPGGAVWIVPDDLHSPLLQDAILLGHGAGNAAAEGFLAYLRSDEARDIIAAAGYGLP
jgi:molybdate transport system substrate-binding protein